MTFGVSAGAYSGIVDKSFVINGSGVLSGGIVITSKKGPRGMNVVTSATEFTNLYGKPTMDNPSMFCALRFLNRGNILSVYRVIVDATVAEGELLVGTDPIFTVTAASEGAWGNKIKVHVEPVENPTFDSVYILVEDDGVIVEKFEVSRDTEARNGFGSTLFVEDVVNKRSRYIRIDDDPSVAGNYPTGATVNLTGGSDDSVAPSSGAIIAAWDEFINPELVPANILINAGWAVPAIHQKMLAVAEQRRDSVAILDVPEETSTSVHDMVLYRKTLLGADTYYGGLYGGWLRVYDPEADREVLIPPSGDVAAVFVHTSTVAERWDAPAGMQRGVIPNAVGVSIVMSEGERDMAYEAGINPVTSYGGANAVIWGQKTLQLRQSALDRFNVVNLVLWLNERMTESMRPYVFQPNTKETRDSVNYLISNFLGDIQKRGGLYDFYVDTSDELNTAQVIDNNQMLVNVFIAPTRTAEFIRISTTIAPTGVTLSSI